MPITDDRYLFNVIVNDVCRGLKAGKSSDEIFHELKLDFVNAEDRVLVCQQARRLLQAEQRELGLNGKSEIAIGISLLVGIGLIILVLGYPEAGRHVWIMRLGIITGIAAITYGIYLKIKPL